MLLRSQERGSFTFHRRKDHPVDGCCRSSGRGLTIHSPPGTGESYWDLALQCMGHPVLPGSPQQKLCPSLKIKLSGSVEPKSTCSFSVDTQVEQHRAPSFNSHKIMTVGKEICFALALYLWIWSHSLETSVFTRLIAFACLFDSVFLK